MHALYSSSRLKPGSHPNSAMQLAPSPQKDSWKSTHFFEAAEVLPPPSLPPQPNTNTPNVTHQFNFITH